MFLPFRKLNSALFHYRSNSWRFDRSFLDHHNVEIDRPVYLLGTQNGGLTLLSRILHRHPKALSVSGDSKYWAGEDEAQNALADILPEEFGWRRLDVSGFPSSNHGWVYASSPFIDHYRRQVGTIDPSTAARYRRIIKGIIYLHGKNNATRFIDKSQSLTVRVGALQNALWSSDPRFVLITRNPYAVIWGQANRNGVVRNLELELKEKVELCAEHWNNSFRAALDDAAADPNVKLKRWKFEELLAAPNQIVHEICDFIDLPWTASILPSASDKIPWGSRSDAFNKRKWYPLLTNVNEKHLSEIPDWAAQIISNKCRELIDLFSYSLD